MTSASSSGHAALLRALALPARVALLTGASAFILAAEPAIGPGEIRLSGGPAA